MITRDQARRLIGHGGSTIRRLRDTSRAFIKIDNEDLPAPPGASEPCQQLRVTGTEAQVAAASVLIDEVLLHTPARLHDGILCCEKESVRPQRGGEVRG